MAPKKVNKTSKLNAAPAKPAKATPAKKKAGKKK